MTDLPSGTVTFLFTDVEESSALWERHRDTMAAAIARQEALLHETVERHRGRVFKTVGDQVCAAFASAADAVRAALAAQRALNSEGWEIPEGLRVRMALHTGPVERRGDDYVGPTLNRQARILAAGHGGQTLVSQTTRQLVLDDLPAEASLRDLGEWRLRGLNRPERLFQLGAPGLPAAFPAPRTRPVARGRFPPGVGRRRWMVATLVTGLLAAAGLYLGFHRDPSHPPGPVDADPALVVLPFETTGPGLEVLREGMVDVLATNFQGVPDLRTIDSRTALASWRKLSGESQPRGASLAIEVARDTGARHAVVGSAVAIGEQLRFTAEILDVESGRPVASGRVEGSADSLLALVDGLTLTLLRELRGDPRGDSAIDVGRATTRSLPALKAYLEGERLLRHSDYDAAISAYQRAVEADSTFALALYRLATAHGWAEIIESDVDRRVMERAARLSDRLNDRDALLVGAKLAFWRGTLDGLGTLREAVRRRPQDAEAWHLLGETSFHLGRQALAPQDENDRAFARAVQLDPRFAPAYVHLIENAFNYHADSVRAERLVAAYRRVTDESAPSRLSHLAWKLAFGAEETRAEARSQIRDLPPRSLLGIALHLWHPRFGAAQEEILTLARQGGGPEAADALVLLFVNAYLRGQLDEAVGYLGDPSLPAGYREAGLYVTYAARLPTVTTGQLDLALSPSISDSFPYLRTFYGGAYAADRERWDDHRRALERLRSGGRRLLAEGDSTAGRFVDGMALGLNGHGLARKGRAREAVAQLEAGQRLATAWPPLEIVNATLRLWLSRLFLDSGDFEQAQRHAGSFWQDPLASFWMAQVHEQREEYDRARAAYQFFIEGWEDADPELQPIVEQARRATARLPRRTAE